MIIRRCFNLLPLLLIVTFCADAQPPSAIELRVGRSIRALDEYLLKGTYESRQTTRVFIADLQRGSEEQRTMLSIVAKCSVVAVTTDGQEKEKRLIIRDFRRFSTSDTADLLPNGTRVRCWFSDSGTVFTINDAPAPDSIQYYLSMVVKGEGGSQTGRLLNPTKPVQPGDTWNMNAKELKNVLGRELSSIVKKVRGTVTYARTDTVSNIPVAVIEAKAEAPSFVMKFDGYPSDASLVTTFTLTVPIDNRYPPEALGSSTHQRIVTKRENVRMELDVYTSRHTTFVR